MILAFEPAEMGFVNRPHRFPEAPILSAFLTWRIAFVSILLLVGMCGLFEWVQAIGARTVAANTLVAGGIVYLFKGGRTTEKLWTRNDLLESRPVSIAVALVARFQLFFTCLLATQILFRITPIDLGIWFRNILFALCLSVLVNLENAATRYYRSFATA